MSSDEVSRTTWLNPETGDAANTGFFQSKDLPPGWEKTFTPEGASYFVNHNERFTTFYHPVTGRIPKENEDFILVDMSDEGEMDPLSETDKRPPPASSTGSSAENVQVSESHWVKAPIFRNHKSPVIKYGWLHKQDSSGMKLWKRRWFVLSDDYLFYYKGSREDNTQGCIALHGCHVAPVEANDHVTRKYTFKVENPGQRTYYLSAENHREMSDWLTVMSHTAQNATCSPRSSQTSMSKRSDTVLKDHGPRNDANDSKVTRGMRVVSRWPQQNGHSGAGITNVDRVEDRLGLNSGAIRMDGPERFYGDWHRDGEKAKVARDGPRKDGLQKASFSLSDLNGTSNQMPTQQRQLQPSHHTTPRQDRRFDTRGVVHHSSSNLETPSHARPPLLSKTRTLVDNTSVSLPKQKIEWRPQAEEQLPSPVSASPPPLVSPSTIPGQPYLHCSNDSGYKYAQDQVLQQKMNDKDKKQIREGTVWQLFEWQQRHKFRYGITAGIGSGQDGALLGMATVPNVRHAAPRRGKPHSISIPPSPMDLPPPSAPNSHRTVQPGFLSLRAHSAHVLTDRGPMTGSNTLGMRSNPEERRRPQSLGGKWGNSKPSLVRSSSMSDKAQSVRTDGNSFLVEEQDIEESEGKVEPITMRLLWL
uniref:pleckstrin homology domain-containing family A member 7-like n=1 Tax=Myxine glutinosa TaxID=7769 RepID=UPI003590189C